MSYQKLQNILNQSNTDQTLEFVDAADESADEMTSSKKSKTDLNVYVQEVLKAMKDDLAKSAEALTPWFFQCMPQMYYETTPREEKLKHLSALLTSDIFDAKQSLEFWEDSQQKVTYLASVKRQLLLEISSKLSNLDIKMGSCYLSKDKLLMIASFFLNKNRPIDPNDKHLQQKMQRITEALSKEFPNKKAEANIFLENLDQDFLTYTNVSRLKKTFEMVQHMTQHEGAHTFVDTVQGTKNAFRLTLGIKGLKIAEVLEPLLSLIQRYEFAALRFFVTQFEKGLEEPIQVYHMVIKSDTSESTASLVDNLPMKRLIKALRTLPWVDSDEYTGFMKQPHNISINGANFIRSIGSWIHILLGKENPYYFSQEKVYKTFMQWSDLTQKILALFRLKFDPIEEKARENNEYQSLRLAILDSIEQIIDPVEQKIFKEAVKFTDHILKTNYFLPTKTGLAFRLSPEILNTQYYPEKPFGIFFITGRNYRAFQLRWKEIARGGVRIVMPRNNIDHGVALSGIFDEVYGLSFAQQLKNKDIPEGGSKAVLVLKPGADKTRAVRGAVNALLDLLVSEDESHEQKSSRLVSYYQQEEIIYLGPDENMTNDLIVWTAEQAKRRGYPYASAFISSKPGEGINHKEYGVTSEGLNVYVDAMLRHLGIDPDKDTFSLKMTGGPDGDVAGNELLILYRNYSERAKVLAISDGYGAAYDPKGLKWEELVRLVKEGKSICEFNRTFLSSSKESFVIRADGPDTIKQRNELHFSVPADIFIPAGGRPYTVNDKNWDKFFDVNGKATCRAVIEGANIFFTKEARDHLQERGILMVKDSSANKTGVICSSYEVIESLLLTKEEFMAIKKIYVPQVIEILRHKAKQEADLLFREYLYHGGKKTLVSISMEISKVINDVTDTLLTALTENPSLLAKALNDEILLEHCPQILQDMYKDRILNKLPKAHQTAILAAHMASTVVYREGLDWVQSWEGHELPIAVIHYMNNHQTSIELILAVEKSDLRDKENILKILKRNAARDLTLLGLSKII